MDRKGGRSDKDFEVGATVLAKNFSTGRRWLEGTILRASGPNSYQIELTDGRVIGRHVNHICVRIFDSQLITDNGAGDWTDLVPNMERAEVQLEAALLVPPEAPEAGPRNGRRLPATIRHSNRKNKAFRKTI